MASLYYKLSKKLEKLVETGDINFFIVFKYHSNKNELQELYRKDPQNFFGVADSKEAEDFARILLSVKKLIKQALSSFSLKEQKHLTFSTMLNSELELHTFIIQTQIIFVATHLDFFSFITKVAKESEDNLQNISSKSIQQEGEISQLLDIEKMILLRMEKLEKLTSTLIDITKQFRETIEKKDKRI